MNLLKNVFAGSSCTSTASRILFYTHSQIKFGKKSSTFTYFSLIFYLFISLLPMTTLAQNAPNVEWDFTSPSTISPNFAKDDNWANKPLEMPDGNFVVAGFSDDGFNNRYPAVFKLNPSNSGRIVWETAPNLGHKTLPIPIDQIGGFQDIIAISNANGLVETAVFAIGYYKAPASTPTGGRRLPIIALLNYTTGNVIYAKELVLNSNISNADLHKMVLVVDKVTNKPFVYIAGHANTQQQPNFRPLVCKVNPLTGNLDQTWAGGSGFVNFPIANFPNNDVRIRDIIQRKDGGFVLVGSLAELNASGEPIYIEPGNAASSPRTDAYVTGLNANGNVEWSKTFTENAMKNTIGYVDIDETQEMLLCTGTTLSSIETENEVAYGVRETEGGNEFVMSCRFDYVSVPSCIIKIDGCLPFSTQNDDYLDCDMAAIKFRVNKNKDDINFLYGLDAGRSTGLDFYTPILKVAGADEFNILGATTILGSATTNLGFVRPSVVKIKDNPANNKFDFLWRKDIVGRAKLMCPFGFCYTKDNGIVLCGNNDLNGDDYEVIKLGNNCQNEFTGYTNNGDIIINTNTTWSQNRKVKGLTTVKTGSTLTIKNCTIELANTYLTNDMSDLANQGGSPTKIIVERGAALILDNCILKGLAACSNDEKMWEGIDVLGNPALGANSAYQGSVKMMNDAQIMNSYYGISAGSRTYNRNGFSNGTGYDGGAAVQCSNPLNSTVPHFLNNRFSVWFAPYNTDYFSSFSSYFKNTNFVCNAPMLDLDYVTAAGERMGSNQMIGSDSRRNVDLQNCTFQGYVNPLWASVSPVLECQGNAANTFNANFKFYNCKISDFNYGIYATYAGSSSRPTYVTSCTFTRNSHNINIVGGAFHSITSTKFEGMLEGDNGLPSYGIRLEGTDGTLIYNKCNFSAHSDNVNVIGIVETNTGANASLVKDCTFNTIKRGVQTEQQNAGLQIRCNQFTGNTMAWSINPINTGSLSDQGECGVDVEQAGNIFNDIICGSYNDRHIHSSLAFKYNYRNKTLPVDPNEIPTCYFGLVVPIKCQDENANTCAPVQDCTNPPCYYERQAAINQATGWNKENLQNQLFSDIASNPSPEFVLSDLLKKASYKENLSFMRLSALIDENKWTEAEKLLFSIPSESEYNTEMIKIFNIVLGLSKAQMSVRSMSDEHEATLNEIALHSTTRAKYQAQAILEVKNDMVFYRPIEEWQKIGSKVVKNQNSSNTNDLFSIVPNPSDNFITLNLGKSFDNKETSNVEIFDLQGRVISTVVLQSNDSNTTIDVSAFKSGIYFVKLSNATQRSTQKIVIQH